MNSGDGPDIFTKHYFRHGLRFDPKHGCRVVFLPDVDQIWVHLNVVPKYRGPYLRRLMESLLYLRDYTPDERDQYLFRTPCQKKKGLSSDPVLVSINYKRGSVRVHERPSSPSHTYKDQIKNGHLVPYPISYLEAPQDPEMRRLQKAHKVVPGQDRTIEQDLWRLNELWLMFVSKEEDGEQKSDDYDENLDSGEGQSQALEKQADNNNNNSNNKGKKSPSPFPSRPQIQLLLEDDVHYFRSIESVPRFDRYDELPDDCEPPPLPIVSLKSRSRDNSSRTESNNMQSASAAVAVIAGGSGVVARSGLAPDLTPSRRKKRRHHRHTDDNHDESHSHSHHRRRHRHRRHKCGPLTAILGRECQVDPHNREENIEAANSGQEALTNNGSFAPEGLAASVNATGSFHIPAASTTVTAPTNVTATTTVDSSNDNSHVSPLSPISFDAARTLWSLRAQEQAHTNSSNLNRDPRNQPQQHQDMARGERRFLSIACKAFEVDLPSSSNSPEWSPPSPLSRSSSRLLSLSSSSSRASSSSRRSGSTVDAASSTHQTNREEGDADDCSSEEMDLDMKGMSL